MDLIALTRAFVDVDSTTFHEAAMGEALQSTLQALALRFNGAVEVMPVAPGRANLFLSFGAPTVVLSTHFDCVPPFYPSSEDDENVYGRGSCDAKGVLASMIVAIEQLLEEGVREVGLLAVVGEERNSEGAYAAAKAPRGAKFVINGEPTEGKLALGSKGALRIELLARGVAAHSAYPELGDSAIDKLLDALARLRQVHMPHDDVLGDSTMNIGVIEGGKAPNVIADDARAEILVRLVDDGVALSDRFREAAGSSVEFNEVLRIPALKTIAIDGFETSVVRFTTDAGILAGTWGEALLYGPGSISVAHTDHEFIAKADLWRAVDDYKKMVKHLIARSEGAR